MRFIVRCATAASLIASAAPAIAVAQNIPLRTLSKPDIEYSEPFTNIAGVRELKDGRVIVADPRDKVVQVVNLSAGSAEKIGREGSGPGEYSIPQRLVALPADSSAVFDPLNRRLLVITPNAKTGGFLELGTPSGRGGMMMMGAAPVADARGRFYFEGAPFKMGADGPIQALDSVAIERWDRTSIKRDTLGYLKRPGMAQISGGGGGGGRGEGGRVSIRIGGGGPFTSQDQWAVAPDGRIALVDLETYRVDFLSPTGARTNGQPIRYDKVKVTEDHKKEWREAQRTRMGMMITNNNGRQSAQMVNPGAAEEPAEWPEFLPPFLPSAVSFSNDGLLWIQRTGPAGQGPTYDLIDGGGKVVQRVALPKRSRVVGFGSNAVYVVRLDQDDLQYLQRFRFAPAERP